VCTRPSVTRCRLTSKPAALASGPPASCGKTRPRARVAGPRPDHLGPHGPARCCSPPTAPPPPTCRRPAPPPSPPRHRPQRRQRDDGRQRPAQPLRRHHRRSPSRRHHRPQRPPGPCGAADLDGAGCPIVVATITTPATAPATPNGSGCLPGRMRSTSSPSSTRRCGPWLPTTRPCSPRSTTVFPAVA